MLYFYRTRFVLSCLPWPPSISSVMFIAASAVTPLTDGDAKLSSTVRIVLMHNIEHLTETIEQHHIPQAWTMIGSVFTVSIAANSLLMFFRVRAVFNHSTPTVVAFGLLWMASVGAAFTSPLALRGETATLQAGNTTIQVPEATVQRFVISSYVITAVYDALVVIAITYQLFFGPRLPVTSSSGVSYIKSLIKGEGLGAMSKTLLQTGLLYYLCVSNFLTHGLF